MDSTWAERPPAWSRPTLLLLGIALALLVAVWAQTRLPDHAVQGGLAYGAAAAIFILSLARFGSEEGSGFAIPAESSPASVTAISIIAFAVALSLAALVLFDADTAPKAVIVLWAASVLLAVYGAWRLDRGQPGGPAAARWTRLELAVLVGIVLLAAFLRVWRIWDFPGVYEDESASLLDAHRVQDGVITTPFVSGTWSAGTIFEYGLAGLLYLGIEPILALKLMGIVPGTLTCVVLYLFLRESFGSVAAAIATCFLAVSSWHILTSRWGYMHALDLLLVTLVIYFIARGLRTQRRLDFALAGTALGLGLVLSKSAATAPLLVVGLGVFFLWRYRVQAAQAFSQHFLLLVLLALLVFAPRALYIVEQPDKALARPQEVFLFDDDRWPEAKEQPLIRTGRNIHELLLTFNYRSGYEPRWNARPLEPTLDAIAGALFVLGFAYTLFRFREVRYFLLLMTMAAIVLPASTALALDDRPVTYRIVGAVPAVYAFAALPLGLLWQTRQDRPGRLAVALLALVLLGGSAYLNYDAYFNRYGTSTEVYHATGQVETRVARQVVSLADTYDVYLTTGEVYYPTVEVITRGRASYNDIYTIDDVLTKSFGGRPLAFVVVMRNKWSNGTFGETLLAMLRTTYPEGREVEGERDPAGEVIYVTYYVDAGQAAEGQAAGRSRP